MILVSLLLGTSLAWTQDNARLLFPKKKSLSPAEAATSEDEIPVTRRKDDKTWIVGYLDSPHKLRPVKAGKQK